MTSQSQPWHRGQEAIANALIDQVRCGGSKRRPGTPQAGLPCALIANATCACYYTLETRRAQLDTYTFVPLGILPRHLSILAHDVRLARSSRGGCSSSRGGSRRKRRLASVWEVVARVASFFPGMFNVIRNGPKAIRPPPANLLCTQTFALAYSRAGHCRRVCGGGRLGCRSTPGLGLCGGGGTRGSASCESCLARATVGFRACLGLLVDASAHA